MDDFEVIDNIENAQNALKSLKTVINKVSDDYFTRVEPDVEKLKNEYETIAVFINIGTDYISDIEEHLNNASNLIEVERSGNGGEKRVCEKVL